MFVLSLSNLTMEISYRFPLLLKWLQCQGNDTNTERFHVLQDRRSYTRYFDWSNLDGFGKC